MYSYNPSGPVANAAALQLAGCVPNFQVLETMADDVSHRKEISNEEITLIDGMMYIPDKPGLGIDINEEAIAEHPYIPRDLRHYNGQLTEIRPNDATPYFRAAGGMVPRPGNTGEDGTSTGVN